jgi:hypothetical protein
MVPGFRIRAFGAPAGRLIDLNRLSSALRTRDAPRAVRVGDQPKTRSAIAPNPAKVQTSRGTQIVTDAPRKVLRSAELTCQIGGSRCGLD